MKYLTIVYSLPAGFDVSALTQHEFASAFAWSHKMDECNGLISDYEKQKHRADALAATIRALQDVVTHDGETKADFVARVRAILGADPDERLPHNAKLPGGREAD